MGAPSRISDRVRPARGQEWAFLTTHAHVLLCAARNPTIRVREIADEVGITERSVQRILNELEEEGYISRAHRSGRTVYSVFADRPLRHPLERPATVLTLLAALER